MKKDIHPKTHPVIFVDTSSGAEFLTNSTMTSEETREINGKKHYVIQIEISSASHPFYTGKQVLVDTARRVEKFEERAKKQELASKTRKGKKAKKVASKKSEESSKKGKSTDK
jgi:large subunit ribosomal protein L31